MRRLVKWLLSHLVQNDVSWQILDHLVLRPARFADSIRQDVMFHRRVSSIVQATFPDLVVRNGPFKGLRYPTAQSLCSALLPKLVGSYEKELESSIERFCSNQYSLVVDVGCAEGYYAVGLAIRMPGTMVHAFDIDDKARTLCQGMADLNGVGSQVYVGGRCEPSDLQAMVRGKRSLIVADCEGYELELFSPPLVSALAEADLLIETHDFGGNEISRTLLDRFKDSHEVAIVSSIDDETKLCRYRFAEIDGLERQTRSFILAERRPALMEWLVLSSRRHVAGQRQASLTASIS